MQFSRQSQWNAMDFPLKCWIVTFGDWGTIHSSFWWFCNAFNYLYSSRSLVCKRARRGICWVNQLSPNLFLFSGGRKHTVCSVFLPAGSDMLTKGAISAHCDNGMKRTKASLSNSEIQACEFSWTKPGRTESGERDCRPQYLLKQQQHIILLYVVKSCE